MKASKALVLFSGGQDSAACLLWALKRYEKVETIGFFYGQRHNIEMEVRQTFLEKIKKEFPEFKTKLELDTVYDLSVLGQIAETSLTQETEITIMENGLPSTFVPGRNIMFLTTAAAHGWRRSIPHLVGGMCETDFSGYPDCRDNSLKSLQVSLSLGLGQDVVIHTPLMWLDKAETWHLIKAEGGEKAINFCIEETHTCYKGDRTRRHEWGYGCDNCPACELRKNGFLKFISKS